MITFQTTTTTTTTTTLVSFQGCGKFIGGWQRMCPSYSQEMENDSVCVCVWEREGERERERERESSSSSGQFKRNKRTESVISRLAREKGLDPGAFLLISADNDVKLHISMQLSIFSTNKHLAGIFIDALGIELHSIGRRHGVPLASFFHRSDE